MGADIIMPQLGETVAEGKIVSWFKKVGDTVNAGDRLFEVETDKVTIDVEAIDVGTLSEIRVGDGATAPVGAVVAVLGGAAAAKTPVASSVEAAHAVKNAAPAANLSVLEEVRTARGLFGKAMQDGIRITPLARRVASEQGIDLKSIVADGRKNGLDRISEKDVRSYLAQQPVARATPQPQSAVVQAPAISLSIGPRDEIIAFSTIRQRTADRLAENWRTIPHVFQALEVDFTAIDTVRKARKDSFKAEHGLSLTFLPFITRAVSIVLKEFPDINARTDGTRLVRGKDVNIGIAIDLDHKGLVVPVLKHADELTVGYATAVRR